MATGEGLELDVNVNGNGGNQHQGNNEVRVDPILTGAENYGPWRRQMELALSARRRFGFVTGSTIKPTTNEAHMEAWNANNNLVISWLLNNVARPIKMANLYTLTAKEIWDTLKRRYSVANGARKYKLSKETYEMSQGTKTVDEYYTDLTIMWDQYEQMCDFPLIENVTPDITRIIEAMQKQKEESRLFQFLNGLNTKAYGALRSNILMMNPLPTVNEAVGLLLQEETQMRTLNTHQDNKESEMSALVVKKEIGEMSCVHCPQMNNHKTNECWKVVGYPSGHPKMRKNNQGGFGRGNGGSWGQRNQQSGYNPGGARWNNNYNRPKGQGTQPKTAANVQGECEPPDFAVTLARMNEQIQQLMKYAPGSSNSGNNGDTDEEIDCNFAGM